MNTASRSNTPTNTQDAGDAARPEHIRQGIEAKEIVGRLTKDPTVGPTSTAMNIAVNVPHRNKEGKWEDNTSFVNALAVGDAHKSIAGGSVSDLKKGAIVKLENVPLEVRGFTRNDQSKDHSLEAKIFKPEGISVVQAAKAPKAPTAAGTQAASGDQPPN